MDDPRLPSKTRVNKAGEWLRAILTGEEVWEDDVAEVEAGVVLAWREQHAGPITLTVPGLRNWVEKYSSLGIMPTQRLKRLTAIADKLVRHDGMKLARMQDIGGTRAILANHSEVEAVFARIRSHWSVDRVADWRPRVGRIPAIAPCTSWSRSETKSATKCGSWRFNCEPPVSSAGPRLYPKPKTAWKSHFAMVMAQLSSSSISVQHLIFWRPRKASLS